MIDKDLEELMNDYLDGELDAGTARDVARMMAASPQARALHDDLARLRDLARGLPREQMPNRDLWEGIAERLERPAGARRGARPRTWLGAGLAAAAAVVLAGSVYLMQFGPTGDAPPNIAATGNVEKTAWQREVARADQQYRDTKEALSAAIAAREENLAPETLAVLETNLQTIDTAVAEIRTAMQDDPQEPRLLRLLVATQEKELNLLQRILEAPEGS